MAYGRLPESPKMGMSEPTSILRSSNVQMRLRAKSCELGPGSGRRWSSTRGSGSWLAADIGGCCCCGEKKIAVLLKLRHFNSEFGAPVIRDSSQMTSAEGGRGLPKF